MRRFTPEQYKGYCDDKTNMAYYVRFYGNALPNYSCDYLVEQFEEHKELHIEQQQDVFKFNQLDISANRDKTPWNNVHDIMAKVTMQAFERYKADTYFDESPRFPLQMSLENFRINRSLNNGIDGFGNHCDIGNYASARRFLTVLYYLADVEEGGDAAFPILDISFKPTKGSVLLFPSNHLYLHCGLKAISNPKYIMTSFCSYV